MIQEPLIFKHLREEVPIDKVLSGKRNQTKGHFFRYANGGDANVV